MKIAVLIINDPLIHDYFGQSKKYNVFSIADDNVITGKENISAGDGCGFLPGIAGTLHRMAVKAIPAGGIWEDAIQELDNCDIVVTRSCTGSQELAVKRFVSCKLTGSVDTLMYHGQHQQSFRVFDHHHHYGNAN